MTVLFTEWGAYPGLNHALQCARECSGWHVLHVAGEACEAATTIRNRLAEERMQQDPLAVLHSAAIARWFVVRHLLERGMIVLPVFVPDWDVLVFSNLGEACRPFAHYELAVSIERGDTRTSPYFINRWAPLLAFCDAVESILDDDRHDGMPHKWHCDMGIWTNTTERFGWTIADTSEIRNDTVFDHHLCMGQERFEFDGDSKRITWRDGHPYFTLRADGRLIRAHTLHCWGAAKGREAELIVASKESIQ